jgi:hypothetical protein
MYAPLHTEVEGTILLKATWGWMPLSLKGALQGIRLSLAQEVMKVFFQKNLD